MLVYETQQDLDKEFNISTELIKTLTEKPTNSELLKLYSLYKQATEGNNSLDGPPITQIKERAKWNAWCGLRGVSKSSAKSQYTEFVKELMKKYQHT
jgi:diazepam-binding inhibitor (GABA receptor modulator, acyl-CoA-binding protein)